MDSLYGSNAAPSFVIANSFHSIADMASCFAKGADYKQVWYNQYCLIDTPNKNDKDNGRIFKRGLNYQSTPLHGAIYVGQIVGPSSGTPYFSIDTISQAQKYGNMNLPDYWYRRYPTGEMKDMTDESGNVIKDADGKPMKAYVTSEGSGTPGIFKFSKGNETGLVPGKVDNKDENGNVLSTTYNDNILYTWCNIRADTAEADSWFYVGLSIPYLVIDYILHSVSPYYSTGANKGVRNPNPTTMDRVDDLSHPYYEKWDMGVEHGIKGDALRSLRVITPTANDVIYAVTSIIIDPDSGEAHFDTPGYPGQQDDIDNKRQILVFDYYTFDKRIDPKTPEQGKYTIYLGDWNIVKKVWVDPDGTVNVTYTHNDQDIQERLVKWIKSMNLSTGDGASGGEMRVVYNNNKMPENDNPDSVFNLTWIKDIHVEDNGDITYTYAGTNGGKIPNSGIVKVPEKVRWVTGMDLDTDNGHFQTDFNFGDSLQRDLDWVKNIEFLESNGDIRIYKTSTFDKNPQYVLSDAKLKLIIRMDTMDDGTVNIYYNTAPNTPVTMKKYGTEEPYKIKYLENVSLATGINDDKHIKVKFNTETTSQMIGDPINTIKDMVVRSYDFHLFALFTDPTHRATISNGVMSYPDGTTSNDWISNTELRANVPNIPDYGANVYWRDYGSIKDDHGVLVGFNVTNDDINSYTFSSETNAQNASKILGYLDDKYPNGLTAESTNSKGTQLGQAVAQKVVTYTPSNESGKQNDTEFYAFDYNTYKWYYLGTIGDNGKRDVKMADSSASSRASAVSSLNSKGLLFTYINTTYSDTSIPEYWSPSFKGW